MKQLFSLLSTGDVIVEEVPSPSLPPTSLLIRSRISLVSAGTERMLLDFGRNNLLAKARSQPDKIKLLLNKLGTDGLLPTIEAVTSKLDQPIPLGYSNVGVVEAVGSSVKAFKVGDRVVSNGPHAELVAVSQTLCAHIPDSVSDESAAFTVLASIALQGIRLAQPTFGETFVVSGLGLIGLLTSQLLLANGCVVLGLDPDPDKCRLAESFGVTSFNLNDSSDPVAWCLDKTDGNGADGFIITAATTSSQPVHTAAEASRQRGRIILVGVTGLDLRRDLFYKKELSFQVSCSYGPGRYDPSYEQECNDYPYGFVRWTQQRNFSAVLRSFERGLLNVDSLISHRFSFTDATLAYDLLLSSKPSLGILLTHDHPSPQIPASRLVPLSLSGDTPPLCSRPSVSFVGAGNYSRRVLIPAFQKSGARLNTIAASNGISPVYIGKKFSFLQASTDVSSLLSDSSCNCVVIATRHDTHASLVQQSLAAGKHVFVEKPLCLSSEELLAIQAAYTGDRLLMVGFNRRFAPLLTNLRHQLSRLTGPKAFIYTVNAGHIPPDHWTQDPAQGGGRLLGEACHFVDLLRHLASSNIEELQLLSSVDTKPSPDTFSLQLRFADGSIGTVHYFANGTNAFPKERLEVFASGKVFRLDNYRKLQAWGVPGFRTHRLLSQDKGQLACCASFLKAVEDGGPAPIPPSELFEVQLKLLEAVNK